MKLESSLELRPGLLHVVPVLNVAILFIMVYFHATTSGQQSGLEINLPVSSSSVTAPRDSQIIFMAGDAARPQIFHERKFVELEDLCRDLAKPDQNPRSYILQADAHVAHGIVLRISEAALLGGHRLILATRPEQASELPAP